MRLKICCIASTDEARLAIEAGASALGLVSRMPSGPGVIDDPTAREIAAAVPAGIDSFLLTSSTDAEAIARQLRFVGATTLQLVDRVPFTELRRLRERLPEVELVQVVHVTGPQSIEEAVAVAPLVDTVLLDSGRLDGPVRELGGTGRIHDWQVSARIVERVDRPVLLAGGLRPENVAEAIRRVRPAGVDVCSGLRRAGALDRELLQRFVAAVRGAAVG